VGGNIGTPVLMRFQPFEEYDFSVLELSSFQLETIDRFYADIAVILNITPDHLNRYENYKEYENAKLNLLKNQKKSQILILNKEIESLKSMEFMGNVLFFGKDSVADNNFIKINFEEKELSLDIQKIPLKGKHFYEDIYVAGLIGLMNGVDIEDIKDVVYNFRGLEHRMEFVTSVNGVDYFNDSKSTTVSSTCRGVESFENQVVLILGGVYKGETFKKLEKYRNVKKIICFGEASDIISEELKSHSPVVVENLEKAVEYASQIASKGDIVLFSPACASFDMFENYIERGNTFKEYVKKILRGGNDR
jgi:UDP-N-acetylmuramoylalanine--D-glutamate ligase